MHALSLPPSLSVCLSVSVCLCLYLCLTLFRIRVLAVVTFAIASFITVALGTNIIVVLSGVVFASISSGFGEITFLAFTALYDKYVEYCIVITFH